MWLINFTVERLTLAGFKAKSKVIIQARRKAAQGLRPPPFQASSPLLSQLIAGPEETVVLRNLDSGLELDLALENSPDFPKALAALTAADERTTATFGAQRRAANYRLLEAVRTNNLQTCENMLNTAELSALPQVNSRFEENFTVLHYAANLGLTDIVLLLIQHQANFEVRTNRLQTPLHLAAIAGHADTVQALAEAGANVNCGDADLWTPLHYAAKSSDWVTATVLLRHAADLGLKNGNGQTAGQLVKREEGEGKLALLDESMASVETHECSCEKEAEWRKRLLSGESPFLLAVQSQ